MRSLKLPSAFAAVLVVSACGGSSGGVKHASQSAGATPGASSAAKTGTTPTGAPASTAPASATPTPASTSISATPSGPPPCRAADLSLIFLGGQGATGHGELGFALRNRGPRSCSTVGYPGVQFLDHVGRALPTVPTHTTNDYFGSVPRTQLTVAPGATVSFRLGVTHGITSTAGCTTAYGLQVIPPNDTAALRTPIPIGAYECRTATVSPLAKGSSAYS